MHDDDYSRIEEKFIQMCQIIETIYQNINYFGGRRSYDNKVLYKFRYETENGTPKIIDKSGNSWLPILSCLRNRYNIKKYENYDGFLLLNFVDRR